MKKRRVALLSALLVGSLAGAGTAAAFLIDEGHTETSGKLDAAIVLDWGETSTVTDISDLSPSTPAYREVSVAAPKISTNANQKAVFTAKLSKGSQTNGAIYGLKVEIATSTWTQEGGGPDSSSSFTPPSPVITIDATSAAPDSSSAPGNGGLSYEGESGRVSLAETSTSVDTADESGNYVASVDVTEATTFYIKVSLSEQAYNSYYIDKLDGSSAGSYVLDGVLTLSYHAEATQSGGTGSSN